MSRSLYLGIDLGTSHSALAIAGKQSEPSVLPIVQLEAPFQTIAQPLLPSVLYLPDPKEQTPAACRLPWDESGQAPLVGRWARTLGMLQHQRAIFSAKSWLCFGDRRAGELPLLPLHSSSSGRKDARRVARELLEHMRKSYEYTQASAEASPRAVVITVPASFDLTAREWTEQAARDAGWTEVSLLEEPLAAFYAWLFSQRTTWRQQLSPQDLVLVCDIGGGTSDFSLIHVGAEEGKLRLDRCAVGRHLLLGGDNMDLALAYHLQDKHSLTLDPWQFQDLQQKARLAKEALLGPNAPERVPLALAGRGSQLFAQTISLEVERSDVEELLVEGFFPLCSAQTTVQRENAPALQEMGLPYESEAAITKHLAHFMQEFHKNLLSSTRLQERLGWTPGQAVPWPTHILLNGGVFHAPTLRERLLQCLQAWTGTKLSVLDNPSYDQAVALGAAGFAALQESDADLRVRSAAARSYYIGIASNQMAVPGRRPSVQGLCVLPQGTEEEQELSLSEQIFGLSFGECMSFRLFSAKDRGADVLGTLVSKAPDSLDEVSRITCTLPADQAEDSGPLPVFIKSKLLASGQLEFTLQHRDSPQNWRLAFDLGADR